MTRPKPKKFDPIPSHAEVAWSGDRYTVFEWEQKLFNGQTKKFEGIKRLDTAVVFPILPNGNILISIERQPHWNESKPTIIAGGIENDETVFEGAHRETLEETGYHFKTYYLIDVVQKNPFEEQYSYTFVAKDLIGTREQELDGGEEITPKEITFEELLEMTKKREFMYKPSFIDEFIVTEKINELKEMFEDPSKFAISEENFG